MLTNAAADRRERVGVIASAEDKAALALAVAVNCERVMIAAGSGIYQGCDAPLCLAAAVAGKLLGRSAPDESLSAAVLEELEAFSPTRTEPEIEALLRGRRGAGGVGGEPGGVHPRGDPPEPGTVLRRTVPGGTSPPC